MATFPRSWKIAVTTIASLLVASYAHEIVARIPGYDWLHSRYPFYIAESIDKLCGVAVCVLAIGAIYQMGPRVIYRRLGLSAPITTGDRIRLFRFAADVDWRSLTRISNSFPYCFSPSFHRWSRRSSFAVLASGNCNG